MTSGPSLRPSGYLDAALIAVLHGECFGDRSWDEAAVADILSMPGSFGYLLADDDEPAGFVLARVAAEECEILSLGVRPERRRRGFGRRLLEAALERASAAGGRVAHLEVSEANLAGRRLYESREFRESGRRPGYYAGTAGAAATAVLLSRRLP